jgi:DNA repair photolyase
LSEPRAREARFVVRQTVARSILSPTSGFIAQAGFTHSLTPARNCTFGCTYCYVPTLGIYGGLKPEDWQRWGQFTTVKTNAPELLRRALRPHQVIYCSPLVDPYQPAEEQAAAMPSILEALIERPPRILAIQTRGPLILRDLRLLQRLAKLTCLRVSFSVTTNRDDIRRLYEPLCAAIAERFAAIDALRAAGIETWVTLAPILPCDPETLVAQALAHSEQPIVADPLHCRASKRQGATTREAGVRIGARHGFEQWHHPDFQDAIVRRMTAAAALAGRLLGTGPRAFGWLASQNRSPGTFDASLLSNGTEG